MSKEIKINQTIAQALAEQIVTEMKSRNGKKDVVKSDIKSDPIVKQIRELVKKKNKISSDIDDLNDKLRRKHKVKSVYVRDASVDVYYFEESIPSVSDVRSNIILASQVEGVPYKEIKKHIFSIYKFN